MAIFASMIEVKLREVAARRGIKNSYQLQKLTGWPPTMCSRLWKGQWTHAYLKTLDSLCNQLKCTPNDLLAFTSDADDGHL
ncbi:MAG: helix-turn-helix transcriptional regulator [Pyrinomonadaceae bacterium]